MDFYDVLGVDKLVWSQVEIGFPFRLCLTSIFFLNLTTLKRFFSEPKATQDEIRSAYKRGILSIDEWCKTAKVWKSRDSLPEALFERHIRMWILPQMQLTGLDWNVWSGRLVVWFVWLVGQVHPSQEAFRWLSDPQQREVYVWGWNHRY